MKKLFAKLQVQEVIPPKNESSNECEDALGANLEAGRFAVADGIGSSFFPGEWSKLLVEQFCSDATDLNSTLFDTQNWQGWLVPIQEKWSASIRETTQEIISEKPGLVSQVIKHKLLLNEPAAATFAGIQIKRNLNGKHEWQGMIIGDSCLFHFRNGKLNSYLLQSSSDFIYHPDYFASVQSHKEYSPTFISGSIESGDIIILVTDALARWILSEYERSGEIWLRAWKSLMDIKNSQDFSTFVSSARENKENSLYDDDIALILLSFTDFIFEAGRDIIAPESEIREINIVVSQTDKSERPLAHETSKSLPNLGKNYFKLSVAHPKLLSKRFASSFLVQVYFEELKSEVKEKIKAVLGENKDEHVYDTELKSGRAVKIKLYSPDMIFSEAVIRKLDSPTNSILFLGKPVDTCQPGKHEVVLSIQDNKTSREIQSEIFSVKVVDFAFDHVSRPLLSKVSAVFLGIGSFTMFTLTVLEQIDKTVGLTSGAAAGVLALAVYTGFYNLYQRVNASAP